MTRRKKRGPAANGAAKKNHQTSTCGSKPTPTPGSQAHYAALADEALRTGQPVADGYWVAIPDVALEGFANGLPVVPTVALQRDDGRSVSFYRRPPGGAA